MEEEEDSPEIRKIRWKCRRGTKELDVILNRFVSRQLTSLSSEELELFNRLLETEDPVLTEWLCFSSKPRDKGMEIIVSKILSADID